ncbi:Wall-associated receptor kinase 2 [Spatholobus suberectus]|nr:Wall-associated receptor kinase 2 [Spatholobus suberectus]
MEHLQLGRVLMFALALVVAVAADQTLSAVPPALNQTLPGCNYPCGDVEIPYPFGIGNSSTPDQRPCFLEDKFSLACNNSELIWGDITVLSISVPAHQMDVSFWVSRFCNDTNDNTPWMTTAFFSISRKENKFLTVGCNSFGYLNSVYDDKTYSTGCLTRCYGNDLEIDDETCSGIGCCQVDIPPRMRNISIEASTFPNSTQWGNCSHSFVVKQDSYNFSRTHLRDQNCKASKSRDDYACRNNSYCDDTDSDFGYRCKCNDGYEGNPYFGCTGNGRKEGGCHGFKPRMKRSEQLRAKDVGQGNGALDGALLVLLTVGLSLFLRVWCLSRIGILSSKVTVQQASGKISTFNRSLYRNQGRKRV